MRTMHASWEAELNCVAVDAVAKAVIVAAWKSATDNGRHVMALKDGMAESMVTEGDGQTVNENLNCRQLRVYNCASLHNLTIRLLVYDGQYAIRRFPFEKIVYLPGGGVTLCRFMNYFRVSGVFSRIFEL
jgi:hypothetical protein